MQFTDAVTVAGTRRTGDGYLIAEARAVRTGIQLYAGHEVGKPDMAMVRVYRAADQVFAQDSLQSFSHAPITIDHPDEEVTADNWKALSVGEVSTAAKQDGQWVMLPLILKDAAAITAMVSGKRQLSAGYVCELDWTPGLTADGEAYDAQQRSIKINHLALVDRARAGSQARIGDAGNWGAAPISWQIWWRDTRTQLSLLIVLNGVPNCGRYDGLYRRSCRNSWNGSGRHGFDRADSDNNRRGQAVVSSPSVRARTRAIQVS